jgi:hypothetical protein
MSGLNDNRKLAPEEVDNEDDGRMVLKEEEPCNRMMFLNRSHFVCSFGDKPVRRNRNYKPLYFINLSASTQ